MKTFYDSYWKQTKQTNKHTTFLLKQARTTYTFPICWSFYYAPANGVQSAGQLLPSLVGLLLTKRSLPQIAQDNAFVRFRELDNDF